MRLNRSTQESRSVVPPHHLRWCGGFYFKKEFVIFCLRNHNIGMEFFKDWQRAEKEFVDKQNKKFEREPQTLSKITELNRQYAELQSIVEKLSEKQKAMLENVPRTEEEWEEFNKIDDDLEVKDEKLLKLFDEITLVIDELPLSEDDLNKQWHELAMEIMKKHHLNN